MLNAAVGCQSTMSVEEARKVTASFQGGAFVPPPRTISDITAILDQQKRDDPDGVARSKALADRKPPETTNAATLAEFYYQRGLAARDVGRTKQEIADLTTAIDWSRKASGQGDAEFQDIMWERAVAEVAGGSWSNAIDDLQASSAATPRDRRGNLIRTNAMLARIYCQAGNLEAAEKAARRLAALLDDSRHWQNTRPEWRAGWSANGADVRARLAEARGRLDAAATRSRRPATSACWPASSWNRGATQRRKRWPGRPSRSTRRSARAMIRCRSRFHAASSATRWPGRAAGPRRSPSTREPRPRSPRAKRIPRTSAITSATASRSCAPGGPSRRSRSSALRSSGTGGSSATGTAARPPPGR